MKKLILLISIFMTAAVAVFAQGTAFNYQGRLNLGTNPVPDGLYNFGFALYSAATGSFEIVSNNVPGVGVTNGLLSVTLDFGRGVFIGESLWLQISVQANGGSSVTTLNPRVPFLPTPYAIFAEQAGNAYVAGEATNETVGDLITSSQPTSGQVLSFNGSGLSWVTQAGNGGLTLPYSGSASSSGSLFTLQNTGSGPTAAFLGNVGIGTASPVGELGIYGNSAPGADIPADTTVLASGDGFHNRFMSVDGNDAVYLSMWQGTYGEVSTYNYATATGMPLVLNSNGGNVGIGTTTPSALLDVVTSSNNTVAVTGSNSYSGVSGQLGVSSYLLEGEFVYAAYCGVYGNGNVSSTLSGAAGDFAGYFDGNVAVQGDVGIGNLTTPAAPLDVEGNDNTDNFLAPVALIRNNDQGSTAAPTLTVAGKGNCPNGVLCVTTSGTGALAYFGNGQSWVTTISTNGTVYANGVQLTSDRNAKENFTSVNAREMLDKVVSLPVTRWNYKAGVKSEQHIGPMAQDFHATFGLDGTDDKHISVVDEGGVALAAIQGLNQKLDEKDAEIQDLKQSVDQLKSMVQSLEEKK